MIVYFSRHLLFFLHLCPLPLIFFLLSEKAGQGQSFETVIALKPDIIKISFITITEIRVSLQ